MPPGDLQPLEASGLHLLGVEPPQQHVVAAQVPTHHTVKKRRAPQRKNVEGGKGEKKRKSKKPFEDIRNGGDLTASLAASIPDSSNNHLGEVQHDHDDVLGQDGSGTVPGENGNGGSITENWSDQRTMKAKVSKARFFALGPLKSTDLVAQAISLS
jgi:hypothetical protein